MAKETKKAAQTAAEPQSPVETTVENVVDQIKAKNVMTDSAVQAALDEIEKEKDEKKKYEAKNAIKETDYINLHALLELRRRRAEEKATKEFLAKTKDVKDRYLSGKLTLIERKKELEEAAKKKRDAFHEIEKDFSNNIRELRNAYPGYYCYEWDYCF